MFVILGVDTDFDKLHVVLEVSGLLLKNFLDPFSILRWAVDLDGVSRIQKRNVYLSEKTNNSNTYCSDQRSKSSAKQ